MKLETLFVVLPSYSNISNVLRGKTIEALASRYRLVILTPFITPESARLEGYLSHPNLIYERISVSAPLFWGIMNKYIRHAFLREYDHWRLIRHWFYRPTHPRFIRFLTALGSILPKRFFGPPLFTRIESLLAPKPKHFLSLIKKYNPSLLVTATPGYSLLEAECIVAARKHSIPTVAIDINFDNPHSQAKFLRNTDFILVWNDIMKQEVAEYNHYDSRNVFPVGCLRFDHYFNDRREEHLRSREEFFTSKGLDPKKKTIVYITQTPVTYPARFEFMEELAQAKKQGAFLGDPNILIRLHPFDTWEPYKPFEATPGIHIERAGVLKMDDSITKSYKIEMRKEDLINLTETLLYGDVLINLASTMLIEGCIFNKPTVSMGFPEAMKGVNILDLHNFEDIKEMLEIGRVPIAKSFPELIQRTNNYLSHPSDGTADRERLVQSYVQFTDGNAWKRTAEAIQTILQRATSTSS